MVKEKIIYCTNTYFDGKCCTTSSRYVHFQKFFFVSPLSHIHSKSDGEIIYIILYDYEYCRIEIAIL